MSKLHAGTDLFQNDLKNSKLENAISNSNAIDHILHLYQWKQKPIKIEKDELKQAFKNI